MAAESYKQKRERFRENATITGLSFTFSQAFSVIPAAIGHLIDTLLYMDHVFFKGNNTHLSGPFGLLLGSVPFLVGLLLGEMVQQILNIPMYIGFVIDKLLHQLLQIIAPQYQLDKAMLGGARMNLPVIIYHLFSYLTVKPPVEMNGFFGFALGFLPQVARRILHVAGELLTCIPQFIADNMAEGIHSLYTIVLTKNSKTESETQNKNAPGSTSSKPKYQRAAAALPAKDKDLRDVEEKGVDLFSALGITLDEFEKNPRVADANYKKFALTCHPDKVSGDDPNKAEKEEKFKEISRAAKVLKNKENANHYVAWYKKAKGYNPTVFGASGSANSATPPVVPLSGVKQSKYNRPANK